MRIAVDHQLVRTGPYSVVRHPIYTGVLIMYLGLAVAGGQIHSLVGLLMILLVYWRKTSVEEELLRKTFGAEFDDYRRRTWALIPMVL